jgi:ankyrin repeat protein
MEALDIVKLLLFAKADPNKTEVGGANLKDATTTRAGIEAQKDQADGITPSFWAVEKGNIKMMKMLLEGGADKAVAMRHVAKKGSTKMIESMSNTSEKRGESGRSVESYLMGGDSGGYPFKDGRGHVAAFLAAEGGNNEILKILIQKLKSFIEAKKGVGNKFAEEYEETCFEAVFQQRNDDELCSLHVAAMNGHTDAVKELLAATLGDQPPFNRAGNLTDKDGQTALYLAVKNGHVGVVTAMLDGDMAAYPNGRIAIDPNKARNDGQTPLHLAIQGDGENRKELFSILVKGGASFNDLKFFSTPSSSMENFDLRGLDLSGVIFEGLVHMEGAMIDTATKLEGAKMDQAVDLAKLNFNGMPADQVTPIPTAKAVKKKEERTVVKFIKSALCAAVKSENQDDEDSDSDSSEEGGDDEDSGDDDVIDVDDDAAHLWMFDVKNIAMAATNQSWLEDLVLLAFLGMLQRGRSAALDSLQEAISVLVKSIKLQIEQQKNLIRKKVRTLRADAESVKDDVESAAVEKMEMAGQKASELNSEFKDKLRGAGEHAEQLKGKFNDKLGRAREKAEDLKDEFEKLGDAKKKAQALKDGFDKAYHHQFTNAENKRKLSSVMPKGGASLFEANSFEDMISQLLDTYVFPRSFLPSFLCLPSLLHFLPFPRFLSSPPSFPALLGTRL